MGRKPMNKPKAPIVPETTMTPTEQREEWNRSKDMIVQLNKMSRDTKIKVFIGAGVGTEFFTCYMCGGVKPKSMFYTSTDYNVRTGVTRICKACFEELAQRPSNKTTDEVDANREALKYALEYVDQPFYERLYKSAVREASVVNNKNGSTDKPYKAYKRTIAAPAYKGLRYRDGEADVIDRNMAELADGNKEMTQDEYEEFQKNKADALRVVGYYPFEDEALTEQPQLYAEFSGYLDEQKDEYSPYWLSSVIQIIKNNVAIMRLKKFVADLSKNPEEMRSNLSAIKEAAEAQAKLTNNNLMLAKENCISIRNNKSASRGEDSWTGQMRKLRDLNLRDYDVNRFDIDTCKGMQQVADISMASILKELSFDENDYTEIIKTQREMVDKAHHEAAVYKERARLLLKENLDLKRFMDEQGVKYQHCLTNNALFEQGFFSAKASSVKLDGEEQAPVFDVPYDDLDEDSIDEADDESTGDADVETDIAEQ